MRLPGGGNMAGRFAPRRMIIYSPGINRRDLSPATREHVTLCRAWEEVIAALRDRHGPGTRVAVFPCSAIQLAV
jgi:hypothetical protein